MTAFVETGARPLVAVICRVPLIGEALASTMDAIAEVRPFPADGGDTDGLLRSLQPDAIVVDCDEEAEAAEAYARDSAVPLVCVHLRKEEIRAYRNGAWEDLPGGVSPEEIRNVLIGGIFGRRQVA
jgi:hypothetical protein